MSHVIVLPDALYEAALGALRAALRLALPGSAYGRLARWRGASKNRRAQARVARIARSASREVLDG